MNIAKSLAVLLGAAGCVTQAKAAPDTGARAILATENCATKFSEQGGMAKGLDLSSYQGEVDWDLLGAQDRHYVFIRAGHGAKKDRRFDLHWGDASGYCMLRGPYFFFNHTQDVGDQAALFAALAAEARGELPAVIDVEGLNARDADAICSDRRKAEAFAKKLETLTDHFIAALGAKPIIYTAPGFWNCLPMTHIPAKTELWIAHYTKAASPGLAEGWADWRFWQFSDTARDGDVTIDADRFNGSPAALKAYAQTITQLHNQAQNEGEAK